MIGNSSSKFNKQRPTIMNICINMINEQFTCQSTRNNILFMFILYFKILVG